MRRLQSKHHADVAQLVERDLAKVEVAGSSPVVRSKNSGTIQRKSCTADTHHERPSRRALAGSVRWPREGLARVRRQSRRTVIGMLASGISLFGRHGEAPLTTPGERRSENGRVVDPEARGTVAPAALSHGHERVTRSA